MFNVWFVKLIVILFLFLIKVIGLLDVVLGEIWLIVIFFVVLEKCLLVINVIFLFKLWLIIEEVGVNILGIFGLFLGFLYLMIMMWFVWMVWLFIVLIVLLCELK